MLEVSFFKESLMMFWFARMLCWKFWRLQLFLNYC